MSALTSDPEQSTPHVAARDAGASRHARPHAPEAGLRAILPGLVLTVGIAVAALTLHRLPGLATVSPMILAIIIGMGVHNVVGTPQRARPGIVFALRRILRFAIVLLGLQLTAAQVAAVGATGLAVIAATLIATFVFTVRLGRALGVDRKLAELIAAGTSICGASAVIATNTVTEAHDEDVAYAVACVTVFGSIAMVAYPLLPEILGLTSHAYGLWAGASIHEIAQVVAAAYQDGQQAGDFATVAKLSRVLMLAPVVLSLGLLVRRRARRTGSESAGSEKVRGEKVRGEKVGGEKVGAGPRVPVPWFVIGFVVLVGVNSVVAIPDAVAAGIAATTSFLLATALAAMGLETDIGKLRAKGLRPLLLGLAAFLFVATFSLTLVMATS